MILYCVRHGETVYNSSGRIQGQTDSELSDLGRRQGQSVAAALGQQPLEAVFSSPLRRAREAAQLVASACRVELRVDHRLQEINAGIFQGLDWQQIGERYPAEAARWRGGDPDFQIPRGESRRQLMVRAEAAFVAIRAAGFGQVAVVSHGGLLAAALKTLLNVPPQRNPFKLDNGTISRLAWERDVKLLSLNLTDHLHGLLGGGGEL